MKFTCLIFALVLCVECHYLQSPCPSLFAYRSDASGVYGVIQLKSTGGIISKIHLRANFTLAAQLASTYVGQIQTIGGDGLLQKFNRGVPISYRVNFPVTSPIPRLTAIIVNGETLCYGPGDLPAPNQYITTISLDHMLYLKGTLGEYFDSNPGTNVVVVGQDNVNTQIFTINDVDDTWDSEELNDILQTIARLGFQDPIGQSIPIRSIVSTHPQDPFNIINHTSATRPVNEQPPTRPTNTRPQPSFMQTRPKPEYMLTRPKPDYSYYPEQTTEATRAPPPPPPPSMAPTVSLPSTPPRLPASSGAIECGVVAGGNERIPLIYNGNAYSRGEWPWLVAVYKRQEGSLTFICSGTLVSERHVVTAAHCMQQKSKFSTIKDIVVKVGVYNLEDWGDDISVTRTLQAAKIHESYNATTLENDILVFTMERTVEFNNYIRPACLWSGNTDLGRIVGASGVVAGWGASEVGPVGQGEPRMVRIPVVSTAACRASKPEFHKLTSSKTLCAGDRKGAGPCLGDSGGGLYILDGGRWRIRGIVSLSLRPPNGDNTCNLNEYIVFTDTAQYLDWIRKVLSHNFYDT